ncbi:MAG: hypothetical protein R3293_10310, partial [Candidatus Promineifilaceae bacterium]|nr:hypothetical protein [Candidatus Promineifilaceae bacterium]
LAISFMDANGSHYYLMANAYWEPLRFQLPDAEGQPWSLWINTSRSSPVDIQSWDEAAGFAEGSYEVDGRSIAVMIK